MMIQCKWQSHHKMKVRQMCVKVITFANGMRSLTNIPFVFLLSVIIVLEQLQWSGWLPEH
jgi:hypothetical protein